MPKWVPYIVGLFLLFVIYQQPDVSADFARNFGSFLFELLRSFFQFLGGLFGGIDGGGGTDSVTTNSGVTLPGSGDGTVATTILEGDHTVYHTHPTNP